MSLHGARALTVVLWLGLGATGRADDWPQWLGPQRDAISAERGAGRLLPEPKRIWTNAVGLGVSSVVVSGGRAFTIGSCEGRRTNAAPTRCSVWRPPRAKSSGDTPMTAAPAFRRTCCLTARAARRPWTATASIRSALKGTCSAWKPPAAKSCGRATWPGLRRADSRLWLLRVAAGLPASAAPRGQCAGRLARRPGQGHRRSGLESDRPECDLRLAGARPHGRADCAVFLGSDAVLGVDPLTGRTLWRHGTWGHAWMGQVVRSNQVFVANASLPRGCGLLRIEGGKPGSCGKTRAGSSRPCTATR